MNIGCKCETYVKDIEMEDDIKQSDWNFKNSSISTNRLNWKAI
jgi:hypothetical protein